MSLASYLLDAAGFGLVPSAVLVAALMFASAVAWSQLRQGADRQGAGRYGDVLAWAGVVGAVTAWLLHGTDGFRAFYSVIAGGTAITAGFVFLIARRLGLPAPFAVASVLLLPLPATTSRARSHTMPFSPRRCARASPWPRGGRW